jgi:hypothetical protein
MICVCTTWERLKNKNISNKDLTKNILVYLGSSDID